MEAGGGTDPCPHCAAFCGPTPEELLPVEAKDPVLQKMTTLNLHPWNFMPMEILEHIFSFLPVRERHNVSSMCKLWATAVSTASVWRYTEVHCDSKETDKKEQKESSRTLSTLLQKIEPYMGHIRYLKLLIDMSLVLFLRLACTFLDVMAQKSLRLQGLQIVCYSETPFFIIGEELLHSLGRLLQGMDQATMQHVDLRQMPFFLDNGAISLVARCSPNLRTLLMNNHALSRPRMEMTVEVLRGCPKLSTLRVPYFALSRSLFQELLRPDREPFKYLEMFHNGIDKDIPEDCWTSVRERHPGFRVGLEFAPIVTVLMMTQFLKPYLPISQLHFNSFNNMAHPVTLVANLYAGTLEKLVLLSSPSLELNLALIQLSRACTQLKEIHCFDVVAKGVVNAFRRHCPQLKKYTLSHTLFFPDSPPTVVL